MTMNWPADYRYLTGIEVTRHTASPNLKVQMWYSWYADIWRLSADPLVIVSVFWLYLPTFRKDL